MKDDLKFEILQSTEIDKSNLVYWVQDLITDRVSPVFIFINNLFTQKKMNSIINSKDFSVGSEILHIRESHE